VELKNKKWTEEEFFKTREEVLAQWPTGKEVDLQEAIDYNKKIPAHKNFAKKLIEAKESGITLAQPRAGVALLDSHIELLLMDSQELTMVLKAVDKFLNL